MQQPLDRGSGGGLGYGPATVGSEGGGAICLTVGGTLTLNGSLSVFKPSRPGLAPAKPGLWPPFHRIRHPTTPRPAPELRRTLAGASP
jgi:hypothetical protein